jgi:hypothetical protein
MDFAQTVAPAARVYRMHWAIRGCAAAFLAFSFLGLLGFWSGHSTTSGRNPSATVEWAGIGLFAAGWAIYVFNSYVVLLENAIELRTPLGTKRLRFEAIRGRRERVHRNYDGSYIRYLTLIPKDGDLPAIKFQKFYGFDSAFYEWYNKLPDLDRQPVESSRDISV